MEKERFSDPVDLKGIRVSDQFWEASQRVVRTKMLPYQWEALNDRVPDAEPSYCMHNFRAAARLMRKKSELGAAYQPPRYTYRGFQVLPDDPAHPEEEAFYGFVFQDSDFYKWIEAVAYSLTQHPDPELEQTADQAIEVICAAQHESGYLDTYYILSGLDGAFTNLKDHHELYCMGHLIEAAVAYYQATGKDRLLNAARRFADYVDSRFGPEPGQCRGYPGHEVAEMALVRLYQVTGEEKYLALARFFIDQRGTDPHYYDQELRNAGKPPETGAERYIYLQAHKPVREQEEAVGHAVRAVYLYSGMADLARLSGDESLLAACRRLWDSIVREKLYVTGGIGGTREGEAFSYPFDLPNDTAYSETCAAIGLAFFARRMLQLSPRAEYGDVMERALYNTVLAGMALDGESFFYVNPLAVDPKACRKDVRLSHVKPVRQRWFGCACCPPNIARIVGSVGAYAYTENAGTLWTHLYLGGEVTKQVGERTLRLTMESAFPWEGKARMTVHTEEPVRCTLAFRLPGWRGGEPRISAPASVQRTDRDGYCYFTGEWRDGDAVALDFPMPIRLLSADPRVREDIGKAAVIRGPITYCMEEADNGGDLHLCRVDTARFSESRTEEGEIGGRRIVELKIPGLREEPMEQQTLYRGYVPAPCREAVLRLIPYYAWANRGEGEMQVWLRT